MPNTNIAELNVQIKNNAKASANALRELAEALEMIGTASKSAEELKNVASRTERVSKAVTNIKSDNIEALRARVVALSNVINPLVNKMNELNKGFENIKKYGNMAMKSATPKVEDKAESLGTTTAETPKGAGKFEAYRKSFLKISATAKETANTIKQKFSKINSIFNKNAEESNKTSKSIKKIGDSAKKSGKHVEGFLGKFSRLFTLKLFRMAVQKVIQSISEGISNLYSYSGSFGGEFSKSLDGISTSFNYLKNSIGAVAGQLLTSLAPVLTKIMDLVAGLANAFAGLIASFRGVGVFSKATKSAVKYGESASKSASGANDSMKELKKTILGIDELNLLNDNKDTSGGGGGADAGVDPTQMFEEASTFDLSKFEKLKVIFGDIKNIVMQIVGFFKTLVDESLQWVSGLNLEPMFEAVHALLQEIQPFLDSVFNMINTIYVGLILPIFSYLIEEAIPRVIKILTPIFGTVSKFLNSVTQLLAPIFENVMEIVSLIFDNITPSLSRIVDEILPQILDIVVNVLTQASGMLETLMPLIESVLNLIAPILDIAVTLLGVIIGLVGKILDKVMGIVSRVVDSLAPILVTIVEVIGNILTIVSPLLEVVGGILSVCIDLIFIALEPIVTLLGVILEAIQPILNIIADIINVVIALVDGALQLIIPLIDFLTVLISGFADIISGIFKVIFDIFTGDIDSLGKDVEDLGKTFVDVWNKISGAFDTMIEGIEKGFKSAVNALAGALEGLVNGIVDSINSILSGVNWVISKVGSLFGANWGGIGLLSHVYIPRLETGGILQSASLFFANENGAPEFVGRFGNDTGVANTDQMVEAIAGGVRDAQSEQNDLLMEQNNLLRDILNKETGISVGDIQNAFSRQNRISGKTIVQVG